MFAQVQRLASVDDQVATVVLLDVITVHSLVGTPDAFWVVEDMARRACARADRELILVIAPESDQPRLNLLKVLAPGLRGATARAEIRSFFQIIRRRRLKLIYSKTESLPSLAYEIFPPGQPATLVVGSLSDHDLWCLSKKVTSQIEYGPVASILNIATGRLWLARDVVGGPEVAARVEATLRKVTREYKKNYKDTLARQLGAGLAVMAPHSDYEETLTARKDKLLGGPLPRWFTNPWANDPDPTTKERAVMSAIDSEELRLLGLNRTGPVARAALARTIAALPDPRLGTGYICADVRRGVNNWRLERVVCRFQDRWVAADHVGAATLLKQFVAAFPERWFGPRMIDLLAWMIGNNLPLPARTGDPAWAAFVLAPEVDTDKPLDLANYSARVLRLPLRARAWLGDIKRDAVAPAAVDEVDEIARCLPMLDRTLTAEARRESSLALLLEKDIEATIPVLAAIERRGVGLDTPCGCSSWSDFAAALEGALNITASEARTVLQANVDFFGSPKLTVRAIEKSVGVLIPTEKEMRMADLSRRYLDAFDGLETVRRARTLGSFNMERPLRHEVQSRARSVHAITVPQKNGRLGLSRPRLQSLSKRSPEGLVLRSALTARPDYILVACDYNAFEARLAADLSDDPILLASCNGTDVFVELAKVFFGSTAPTDGERTSAKLAFYAILYGQTKDQFWKKHHNFARTKAEELFDLATQHLTTLLDFRSRMHFEIDLHHHVETRGGWRRTLHARTRSERHRDGFSALIQGLAADIFRRVLRELEVSLAALGAGVVHHVHDETFTETPVQHVGQVEQIVQRVMISAPHAPPALLKTVPLVVKPPRRGSTWADLA